MGRQRSCPSLKPSQNGSFASERSINQILAATFEILTYERVSASPNKCSASSSLQRANPHLLGASVNGRNEAYTKLKKLKTRLLERNDQKMYEVFFVIDPKLIAR